MNALEIRLQWMKEYGLPEDEQQRLLIDDPPVDVVVEERELMAVKELNALNSTDLYDKLKNRLDEIKKENGLPEDYKGIICTYCRKPVLFDEEGNGYCNHLDERPK